MAPALVDISYWQRSDASLTVYIRNAAKQLLDLTGCTFVYTVRENKLGPVLLTKTLASNDILFVGSPTNGTLSLLFNASDSDALPSFTVSEEQVLYHQFVMTTAAQKQVPVFTGNLHYFFVAAP